MTLSYKIILVGLRLTFGWMFLYAGITKLIDPTWSAGPYLAGAKSLKGLYQWLASPGIIPVTNFLNEWGLTFLGISLIFGIGIRVSGILGALLMLLYWFPILDFPRVGKSAFLVDQHIIFALLLLLLGLMRVGRIWGLDTWCANLPICRRYPRLHAWWG